jgi:hypothetical protein
MAIMKITEAQAKRLLDARGRYDRKSIKKSVFTEIRNQHGIPRTTKFKVAIEDPSNPDYLVIRGKYDGKPLDDGTTPAVAAIVPGIASSPIAHNGNGVDKALEDDVAAAAITGKTKAVIKKIASGKSAAKPAAKKVAAKAPVKKAVAPSSYPKDVRITVDGKRVRVGKAEDAAHETRLVKKYKKEHGIA